MPHSSGGGSSSGGSHSGSSSSHSSSSSSHYGGGGGSYGPSYRVENHHFDGARRFVYYRGYRPHYVYSDTDLRNKPQGKVQIWRYFLLLFFLPFIVATILIWSDLFGVPVKPLTKTSSYTCTIQDNADVLSASEEIELQEVLNDFFDETGIPVAFYTDVNSTWKESYTSLQDYAYDLYCNNFYDEYHWVIIYTQSQAGDTNNENWYWEGMQGDYTDQVMDVFINVFNLKVQSSLMTSGTVCEAFANAFETATKTFDSQAIHIDTSMIAPAIIMTVVVGTLCYFSVFCGNGKPRYKNSELLQVSSGTDLPKTETCANCGGVYVADKHRECPHCGAKIIYQSNDAESTLFQ